jgi:hypothetical protein
VRGSFEQSVRFDGVDREELPAASPAEETSLYRALKVPVVECHFVVRGATSLDAPEPDTSFGLEWDADAGALVFDSGVVVGCSHPNLEIEATDRVVAWRKVKFWRVGGVEWEGPWGGE